jgi:hypothetical protein
MTGLRQRVVSSVILAGMGVLFQTISFVIPGWFISETRKLSVNMAIWYVIVCDGDSDDKESCDTISYKRLYSEEKGDILTHFGKFIQKCTCLQI